MVRGATLSPSRPGEFFHARLAATRLGPGRFNRRIRYDPFDVWSELRHPAHIHHMLAMDIGG